MTFKWFISIIFAVCCVGCASTPTSIDTVGQRRVKGTVIRVTGIPTTSSASDQQREWMGSMYGALGLLMTDILSTKKGYPIYVVKAINGLEMNVASNDKFEVGECVVVWFPESMGQRPDLGPGKAGIAKDTDCSIVENK